MHDSPWMETVISCCEASGSSHAGGYEMTMKGAFQPAMEGISAFSQTLKARRVGNCK